MIRSRPLIGEPQPAGQGRFVFLEDKKDEMNEYYIYSFLLQSNKYLPSAVSITEEQYCVYYNIMEILPDVVAIEEIQELTVSVHVPESKEGIQQYSSFLTLSQMGRHLVRSP